MSYAANTPVSALQVRSSPHLSTETCMHCRCDRAEAVGHSAVQKPQSRCALERFVETRIRRKKCSSASRLRGHVLIHGNSPCPLTQDRSRMATIRKTLEAATSASPEFLPSSGWRNGNTLFSLHHTRMSGPGERCIRLQKNKQKLLAVRRSAL